MRIIPREVAKRKPITWSREIRNLQKRLKLTPLQKEVLIGTLLGDGCLVENVYGKNYRLKIEHAAKERKYVWWKLKVFEEWTLSLPKFQKKTNSWRFRTISHPVFTRFHQLFYRNGKKILPKKIDKFLRSPVTLAVWFMDDGALGPNRQGVTLNTQNFTREEDERLRKYLTKIFHLETSLHKDKRSWRIYIFPRSVPQFTRLVEKIILPEFKYKLSFR
ncbi:hypothetical protein KJA16_02595 [Patescibacteria group bacterium]|nr:hypothetical protein [Patescibacteria group bacterium]